MDKSLIRFYHEALGLKIGASLEDIKQAHDDLLEAWHPYLIGDDPPLKRKAEEKIKEINIAYDRLVKFWPEIIEQLIQHEQDIVLKSDEKKIAIPPPPVKPFLHLGKFRSAQPKLRRRFWARVIDFTMLLIIVNRLDFLPDIFSRSGMQFLAILYIHLLVTGFVLVLYEAILLSKFSTTLGRTLFYIKVNAGNGEKLTFLQAFRRSFSVLQQGWFLLGFPFITLFLLWKSFLFIQKNGAAKWDKAKGFRVTYGKLSSVRYRFGVTLGVCFVFLIMANSMIAEGNREELQKLLRNQRMIQLSQAIFENIRVPQDNPVSNENRESTPPGEDEKRAETSSTDEIGSSPTINLPGKIEANLSDDQVIDAFTKTIANNPNDAVAHYNRGTAYEKKGLHDKAIEDYNRAITLDPNLVFAYNNRGTAYEKKGLQEKAMEDYNKAIAVDPKNPLAYFNRGTAYLKMGQLDKAIEDYNKAIALDVNNALLYNNRGLAYGKKGLPNRAVEDYDRAIALDPNYAMAYYNRALAHKKLGDSSQAIADQKAAAKLGLKEAQQWLMENGHN